MSAPETPLARARSEFSRQARAMAAAPAFRDDRAIEPFVRLLGPPGGGPVLDLACGPGIVAEALGRAGHQVVGIDATSAMLARARSRWRETGLAGVRFSAADAERLPFASGAFDGAVSRLAVHHFQDPARVFAELRRVLSRGSVLVIGDIVCSPERHEADLHNALETLRDPSHQRFLTETELCGGIESASFEVRACERWDNPRSFGEWAAIVADARSLEPLACVMRALAGANLRAGIDLRDADGALTFTHSYRFVCAAAR